MTARKALGYSLLASPFVGIFIMAAYDRGLMFALGLFGSVCAMLALFSLGSYLAGEP